METFDITQMKSFAGGFVLGYLCGYFIRKGLKLFIVVVILLAVIIHMTDFGESLATIWSLIGRFVTKAFSSAFISVKDMIGIQLTGNAFSLGFMAGLVWSLVKS